MRKFLVLLLAFYSLNTLADCIGQCYRPKTDYNVVLGNLGELIDQTRLINDSRKIYDSNSPDFLESYGRIVIKFTNNHNTKYCTGNLIIRETYSDEEPVTESNVVTSAAHCFEDDNIDYSRSYIYFTNKQGQRFKRYFSVHMKGNINHDFAILKLNDPISTDDITPIVNSDSGIQYIYKDRKSLTLGGYSSDKYKGNEGENLTYDQDCKVIYTDSVETFTTCSAYYGASGGALVIEAPDAEGKVKPYFVGVIHGPHNRRTDRIIVTSQNQFNLVLEDKESFETLLGVEDEW